MLLSKRKKKKILALRVWDFPHLPFVTTVQKKLSLLLKIQFPPGRREAGSIGLSALRAPAHSQIRQLGRLYFTLFM